MDGRARAAPTLELAAARVGAQPQVHKLCLQMLAPDTAALALRRREVSGHVRHEGRWVQAEPRGRKQSAAGADDNHDK